MSSEYASLLSQGSQPHAPAPSKPTIFDLIAHENMQSLLRTAFNHVFKWLASCLPQFAPLAKYADQLYLALHSLVELAYLRTHQALFSEHFYGMQRLGLSKAGSGKHLLSVVLAVVVPYLKVKPLKKPLSRRDLFKLDSRRPSWTTSTKN